MRQRICAQEIKRLMEPEDPQAAVIESRLAAGEYLLDALLALVPDEPLEYRLSEPTPRSWFR